MNTLRISIIERVDGSFTLTITDADRMKRRDAPLFKETGLYRERVLFLVEKYLKMGWTEREGAVAGEPRPQGGSAPQAQEED